MQQRLYWTAQGTIACYECCTPASSGDGKTVPYVIDHSEDCRLFTGQTAEVCRLTLA